MNIHQATFHLAKNPAHHQETRRRMEREELFVSAETIYRHCLLRFPPILRRKDHLKQRGTLAFIDITNLKDRLDKLLISGSNDRSHHQYRKVVGISASQDGPAAQAVLRSVARYSRGNIKQARATAYLCPVLGPSQIHSTSLATTAPGGLRRSRAEGCRLAIPSSLLPQLEVRPAKPYDGQDH